MNTHAIKKNERAILIIQKIINKYEGVFDPTKKEYSRMMAEQIFKSLKRNKIVPTYQA
jgi:hypothetical protein